MNELDILKAKQPSGKYVYGAVKECPQCGAAFRAREADTANYTPKYCSGGCRNKARAVHQEKPCLWCQRTFKPIRSANRFCGRKCSGKYRTENHEPSELSVTRRKLAVFCCGLLHRCLRNKTDRTSGMLGYTVEELRVHLEANFKPGMSWANYGKRAGQWSIDHTRPISMFPKSAALKEINALSNLAPMWHSENCSKSNKWGGR